MKLLLTSSGLTNPSIANALFDLTGKRPEETTVVFVPTASNGESGNKDWVITDLVNLQKQHFKSIEITDISAVDQEVWEASFQRADVLFFEGGITYHLMRWIRQSGLDTLLPTLLQDKVYVGVSAGSMVTNPDLSLPLAQIVYDERLEQTETLKGLHLVDFYFLPHLHSAHFTNMNKETIAKFADTTDKTIYALDDNSALKIVDGKVEVISEGEWLVFNEKQ